MKSREEPDGSRRSATNRECHWASAPWFRALPLAAVLLTFLAASSVTWRQPVTSIEMNRNDAAFYLVLARNIVEHGVYSHQQQPPFQPHTEWPPGVPLLYSLPMSFVGGAALDGGRLWIHGFTLLVSSLALIAVYLFVRQRESVGIAIAVTAATMSSHAFLDSAQAATADTIAVAAAFFTLLLLERSSVPQSTRRTEGVSPLVPQTSPDSESTIGLTPNGTHFSGAAQAARSQWSEIVVESREEPDGSRRSATKVSAIGLTPPVRPEISVCRWRVVLVLACVPLIKP